MRNEESWQIWVYGKDMIVLYTSTVSLCLKNKNSIIREVVFAQRDLLQ